MSSSASVQKKRWRPERPKVCRWGGPIVLKREDALNKSYALDKHKADIKKYLKMGLSLSAVAKLVEAAIPTVNDYIKRGGLR